MSKDSEIRRMSLLKSSGISPFSVLNLSLEILKAKAADITVPAIFSTAGEIIAHLPSLKGTVDAINLTSAQESEKWVVGNDVPAPATTPPADFEAVVVKGDLGDYKADTLPVTKTDDNVAIGEVGAVSKTGKGIKIGDVWYNVTSKTKKTVEPAKGMMVRIKFTQGNSGLLVDQVDAV